MPTQKGTDQDACVPGTFVPFHDPPKRKDSARVGWVVAANGCHIWQGARNEKGYGTVQIGGRSQRVHRARYEREVGPIPEGMELDHFACDNPSCCNPTHVRPVAHRENMLRGRGFASEHAAKTHCPKGHAYDIDNLRAWPAARGRRECQACHRESKRMYRRNRRSAGRDGAPSA